VVLDQEERMLVDTYIMTGDDISQKGVNMIIVPKGTDPATVKPLSGKKITFKFKSAEKLEPTDQRAAVDSRKAHQDLVDIGYHVFAAEVKVSEG
jgi:hypothetical protein